MFLINKERFDFRMRIPSSGSGGRDIVEGKYYCSLLVRMYC